MPGATNNTDIVNGLNQTIVTLNELRVALVSQGGAGSEASDLVELIANNIETMRTDLVAQSVAQITAQNTNFSDLSSVLANLQLLCQSVTKVSIQNYYAPYTPQAPDSTEASTPPEPFQDTGLSEEFYQDRKCFMATTIVDEFKAWLERWNEYNLDEITNLSLVSLVPLWIAAMGYAVSEGTLLALVLATTEGALMKLVSYAWEQAGTLEFLDIATAIGNNRDDLICSLYEATTTANARSDFVSILSGAGLSLTNQGFVTIALDSHYLNYLFYKEDDSIEAAFAAATGYDCSGCSGVCGVQVPSHMTILGQSANQITIQAGQNSNPSDPAYYASVYFDTTADFQLCGGTVDIDPPTLISGTVTSASPAAYRVYDKLPTAGSSGNLYHSNSPWPTTITGARVAVVKSLSPFTMQFDWT